MAGAASGPDDWEVGPVGALTSGRVRTGVFGDVLFQPPAALPGPPTVIRWSVVEAWRRDGEDDPYYILPLIFAEELPLLGEVQAYSNGGACE